MDRKKLVSPAAAVTDTKDDVKPKNGTKDDYGTSSPEIKSADKTTEPAELLSCRRILYTMMFLGFTVAYSLRVSLSEAIVAMVNQTADTDTSNTTERYQCPRDPQQHSYGEFYWDRNEQGTVLAAFYYGYILTQVGIQHKNSTPLLWFSLHGALHIERDKLIAWRLWNF